MRIPAKRAFGPWGGFTPPFGWGIGNGATTADKTTSTTTNPPAQNPTQTQTQTQIQTSVITSVTDITSVASATVVTTVVNNPTPTTPPTASSGTSTSSAVARTPSLSSSAHATSATTASGLPSASSAADHDASSLPGSGSGSATGTGTETVAYVTLSLSGSTVTLLSTFGSHPTVAANAGSSGGQRGMSKGELAALVVACVGVGVLSLILCYVWRKRRRVREVERDIHSPTHTISNGMVQAPQAGAVAFGTRGSTSTSAHGHSSVMSSRFSTSDEGHQNTNANTNASGEGRASMAVSGGRTLIGASSENEKSSLASTGTSSPSPSHEPEAETEETPRSSTFLLHPQPTLPLSQAPGSTHLTPPPRTASASPRLLPVPPMSPLMPAGPPGLHEQTRFSASPYAPYAYAWAVQSPTTAASEYSPYAWDNPPPSSEYLPQPGSSSRRTTRTFATRTSGGFGLGAGGGVPPYTSSPGLTAPPMYTASEE